MCAPCKLLLNQGFIDAAQLAELLRKEILGAAAVPVVSSGSWVTKTPEKISREARDDLLLKLGSVEAAAISGVRSVCVDFAEALGKPEWAELFANL